MPGMSPRIKAKKGRFGAGGLSPTVNILSPANGFVATRPGSPALGVDVTFTGEAFDDLGAVNSSNIVWTSDQDGALGTGASVTPNLTTAGAHVITATINDGTNPDVTDTINITVA